MYFLPVKQNKRKKNKQPLKMFLKKKKKVFLRLVLFTEAFKNFVRPEALSHIFK